MAGGLGAYLGILTHHTSGSDVTWQGGLGAYLGIVRHHTNGSDVIRQGRMPLSIPGDSEIIQVILTLNVIKKFNYWVSI